MHYPDLGSASDWLCRAGIYFQPIRNTTKIWVVISMEFLRSLLRRRFARAQSGDLGKRRLFSQANVAMESVISKQILNVRNVIQE